ncbi:MAG: hypothetical protein FWC16_06715 [Defluviitaleaceae bacterium]|nr:hypothetical protein [Defluviitaleaceae bacterium]MCL2274603.1 hypothetical protein [Defluviitaleaceae bacterium]
MEAIKYTLNEYGGIISLLGLLMSVFIYIRAGRVKKIVQEKLSKNVFVEKKGDIGKALKGIIKSINEDDIYDNNIFSDIKVQITMIEKFPSATNKKIKKAIKKINQALSSSPNFNNSIEDKQKITHNLSIIFGELKVDDVYTD